MRHCLAIGFCPVDARPAYHDDAACHVAAPFQSVIEDIVIPQMRVHRTPSRCERGGHQEGYALLGGSAM